MPVNPFSFLAQAISDLLTSNLGLFESGDGDLLQHPHTGYGI